MKKTLYFDTPSQIPSYELLICWSFPFNMVDSSLVGSPEEISQTSPHFIQVSATMFLISIWGLSNERDNIKKVLFEIGRRHIIEKLINTGKLDKLEKLDLKETTYDTKIRFDPNKIIEPVGATYEVEIPSQLSKAEIQNIQKEENNFVSNDRIKELESIKSDRFDLSKLIQFCKELNISYEKGCYLSVALLTRALIDHIPPIFNFRIFTEVANSYAGTTSFKQLMKHLDESSRMITDSHLHTQIRVTETLPNKTQINFSNDIDMLLAEIVRIFK